MKKLSEYSEWSKLKQKHKTEISSYEKKQIYKQTFQGLFLGMYKKLFAAKLRFIADKSSFFSYSIWKIKSSIICFYVNEFSETV